MLKPEDLTTRSLDNKGLIPLYILKRDLALHVLNFELDRVGVEPGHKAVFKEVVGTFAGYRTKLNPHPWLDPDGTQRHRVPDLRWQAGWPGSAKEMLRFTENLVFGDTHDLCLKNAIRGGTRTAADAMQTSSVKTCMDGIMELRNAEKLKSSGIPPVMPDTSVSASPATTAAASTALDGLTSTNQEDEATIFAMRTFHSYVTLHVETDSLHDLKLALNSSPLGSTFGTQNVTNVMVVFDVKQSAEPTAQPHIRIAPLREARLRTLVIGVMTARCESAGKQMPALLPGDLYLMPDAGRRIDNKFRALFVDEHTKAKLASSRQLHVTRSEDGLTSRRRLARHSVKQMETFHFFSGAKLRMPKKPKKFFTGTNLGDCLVEVPVLSEADLWSTDKGNKRAIYGSNFIAVGGRAGSGGESDDDDDEDDAQDEPEPPTKKAKTDDKVPIFFHEAPKVLFSEIINLYSVVGVVDLTAGAGTWAKACLDAGIPYFGVTLTMRHQEELSNHLVEYVKASQVDATSPLFVRGLVAKPNTPLAVTPIVVPPPKKEPNNKKDDKKKKKKKKKDKTSSSESDSSSSPAM
jgi:hypothetical protein